METFGSLVDKLSVINIKLWHTIDDQNDRSLSDKKRLAAADKVHALNIQRNDMISEIDHYLEDAISGKITKLTFDQHKRYAGVNDKEK